MRYVVNSNEMKNIDSFSIETIGIPSMVLMERAALKVVHYVKKFAKKEDNIAAVCGTGNNGGDGIAIARILHIQGYHVDIILLGNSEKFTKETKEQLNIAENLGISIRTTFVPAEYNIIIDAIFGIGLQRNITGEFKDAIQNINESGAFIIAVDIPSGIDANHGKIVDVAVRADVTVTFGENKLGLLLYPGAEYAGEVMIEDIGFPLMAVQHVKPKFYYYEKEDMNRLPKRFPYSNKGSYGKVLIIAGSKRMTGAAFLSAISAYRMGCGLVKVITSKEGIEVIRTCLPEALYASYEEQDMEQILMDSIAWSNAIVIGPGLSTDKIATDILCVVLKVHNKPIVFDADALQLLANDLNVRKVLGKVDRIQEISNILPPNSILTPHLKELSNLLCAPIKDIVDSYVDIADQCTYNNDLIYVLKDARTIVAQKEVRYLNVSGNHGMATGGSGDVLTGVIAGLLATGLENIEAAKLGVFIHGLAGEIAANKKGYHSMLASDIVEALPEVIKEYEGRNI